MAGRAWRSGRGRTAFAAATLVAMLAIPLATSGSAGGAPSDAKMCQGHEATIVGTRGDDRGNDKIEGTPQRDVIAALGGADVVESKRGNDLVCLGGGTDVADGERGGDRIFGDSNGDLMFGGPGDDGLFGGDGDDAMSGEGGRDVCSGGDGDDVAVKSTCETIRGARDV